MPHISRLPPELEDGEALIARREAAKTRKELWRSVYSEAYRFAMPARETFTWQTEGQHKNSTLYDSTLQESTYTAANTLIALLFPPWTRWAELSVGGEVDPDEVPDFVKVGLRRDTERFFNFLNHSNFNSVIGETALDLMVGTGGLTFDEGDNEQPFLFGAIPLSEIEIEEGPNGKVETTWLCRNRPARVLQREYPGLELFDMPDDLATLVLTKPDEKVEIIQGEVYHPETKTYFGVAIHKGSKKIIWRFAYGPSCPSIIARATKVAGELYGRGRVLLALSDAKTLDKMQEFVLRHAALQIAPPMTGVTDGVLNPYTAALAPHRILPVASNDNSNPSLRVLELGGNFQIGDAIMSDLRERVRRTMLGPDMSETAIKSATEISIADRNRLWAMNGEFSRIQSELLAKIVQRGVFILQRKGLLPKYRVDGRMVAVKYNSPFAKSQNSEDLLALDATIARLANFGPQVLNLGLKVEDAPRWVADKSGLDAALVRSDDEKQIIGENTAAAAQAAAEQGVDVAAVAEAAQAA